MSVARRTLLLAAPAMVLAAAAHAADPAAAAPIQALNAGILSIMKAGKSPFTQRFNMLAPLVDGAFDLKEVLAASVGPRLAGLPADQQAALADVFRKFTIASYVANFDDFNGEKLEVLPEQRTVGNDTVVNTRITQAHGDPVAIDYVMRRTASGWRAVDVLLNGSISQNAVKRSDFRSLVSTTSAQPLIDSLRLKVKELSGGALS